MNRVSACLMFIIVGFTLCVASVSRADIGSMRHKAQKSRATYMRQQAKEERRTQRRQQKAMRAWEKRHNVGHGN
jgi:hypothetical protein